MKPCPSSPKLSDDEEKPCRTSIRKRKRNNKASPKKTIPTEESRNKRLAHINISTPQNIFTRIRNFMFHLLNSMGIFCYFKSFPINVVEMTNSHDPFVKKRTLHCTEKEFFIDKSRVPYEYIMYVSTDKNKFSIELVNGNIISLHSPNAQKIFQVISSNMNYHIRYNKIDMNVFDIFKKLQMEKLK